MGSEHEHQSRQPAQRTPHPAEAGLPAEVQRTLVEETIRGVDQPPRDDRRAGDDPVTRVHTVGLEGEIFRKQEQPHQSLSVVTFESKTASLNKNVTAKRTHGSRLTGSNAVSHGDRSATARPANREGSEAFESLERPAIVEISPEEYQQLLAAQAKLEHERALARERKRRYRENHPDKIKEEQKKWRQSPQGRKTTAAIARRYYWRKKTGREDHP